MTLVLAHRHNQLLSLSSDSRINFGCEHIDYGIKIFSVPVKIFSPKNSDTQISTIDYDHKLGLAVVGNIINSYTVKEYVYEILQHLQYITDYSELSMDGICELVFKMFNKTTLDLGNMFKEKGLSELLLAGYCLSQNKIRIFKFSCDISNFPIKPFYKEILQCNGMEFFGSGQIEAKNIYENNNKLSPLHIIRQVIGEGKVDTVGGGLQYGDFKDGNFNVYGIVDYELDEQGNFKGYLYTLRGINLYKNEFDRRNEDFHIAYSFKEPFIKEIKELLKNS